MRVRHVVSFFLLVSCWLYFTRIMPLPTLSMAQAPVRSSIAVLHSTSVDHPVDSLYVVKKLRRRRPSQFEGRTKRPRSRLLPKIFFPESEVKVAFRPAPCFGRDLSLYQSLEATPLSPPPKI